MLSGRGLACSDLTRLNQVPNEGFFEHSHGMLAPALEWTEYYALNNSTSMKASFDHSFRMRKE
jgi:hypothetical protein